jgi:3-dehydroquinate dehydratase/shikimate dehydrogenase
MVTAELQEAVKRGAKFIELRLDFLAKAVDFKRLLPYKQCPWVATLRRPADGGRWSGTEDERKMLIRQAIVSGFEWVDLEHDIAADIPRFRDVRRIVSYHNLTETPADLDDIYERMLQQDADVYKLSTTAQKPEDNVRLMDLLRRAKKPTVAHCMGDIGFPTRLLSLKFGSPFMYAAFNKERGIAPGMPALEELRQVYLADRVTPNTEIYGVMGDPVGHSLSPLLHNRLFKHFGVDGMYLPFRVPRGLLPGTLQSFDDLPVRGYSVTIPHKEAAAILAKTSDAEVRSSRSANTLVRKGEGVFHAANTDYGAAVESIQHFISQRTQEGPPPQLNQLFVLILGAGGAARSVAHALHQAGGHIIITSRTADKAAALAEEVKARHVTWEARHSVTCDVVINCTPVGMHPNVDESPVHFSFLRPGLIVFDTVYTPETTMLIREAMARRCQVITGVEMFVRQAAKQFEMFTGKVPPLEPMRKLVRKALSPITQADGDLDIEVEAAKSS